MTASAVGNTPEKEIDGIKAALMRGVMHADEKFFPFEVWLWVAYSSALVTCFHELKLCDYFILCIHETFTYPRFAAL